MGVRNVEGVGPIRFPDSMSTEQVDAAVESLQRRTFEPRIREVATEIGLDPDLAIRLTRQESRFNPRAVSSAGAQGLMQLMPDTAKELGVKDPFDPEQNIRGGLTYLKRMLDEQGGDTTRALAAYNWGPGNLAKHGLENAPEETRNYIRVIGGGGVQEPSRPLAPAAGGAPHTSGPIGPASPPGSTGPAPENAPEASLSVSKALLRPSYAVARAFGLPQALHKIAPETFGKPEEIAKEYEQASPGVAGTALNIVGAVPSAVSATRMAGAVLPRAFTAAANPYTHAAATTALGTAATTPGSVGERAMAGGINAAIGAPLQLGGRLLAEPIKKGLSALKFEKATGEVANPLGGGEGVLSRTLGKVVRMLPGMARAGDDRATDAAVTEVWRRATPPGSHNLYAANPTKQVRGELFRELEDQFETAYSNVLTGKQMRIRPADRDAITDVINNNLSGSQAAQAHTTLGTMKDLQKGRVTGEQWKELQNRVAEQERRYLASGSAEEKGVGLAWQKIRKELNKIRDRHMSPDEVTQLTEIDNAYRHRLLLEGAAGRAGGEKGITSTHLDKVMRDMAPDDKTIAQSRGIAQDVIDPLRQTTPEIPERALSPFARHATWAMLPGAGAAIGGPLGAAAGTAGSAALYGAGGMAGTRQGSRILFGDTGPQQKLAEFLKFAPGAGTMSGMSPLYMGE